MCKYFEMEGALFFYYHPWPAAVAGAAACQVDVQVARCVRGRASVGSQCCADNDHTLEWHVRVESPYEYCAAEDMHGEQIGSRLWSWMRITVVAGAGLDHGVG
jgi:hypothetical protein